MLHSHALRPYIDSEINHYRHFIKIQFVNKRIEFINLPSIFKEESVISSIPTYFKNKESPIISYQYNKSIRSIMMMLLFCKMLLLELVHNKWHSFFSKIYDKRDGFKVQIVNFPFLDGDVLRSPFYGVYISQLIGFARVTNRNL